MEIGRQEKNVNIIEAKKENPFRGQEGTHVDAHNGLYATRDS